MSVSLCILASGSSGNCTVVRTPHGVMLIDAGLSPRATGKRLDGTGVTLDQIEAICLTHLDGDHFHSGWRAVIVKNRIRVYCCLGHRAQLVTRADHELAPFVRAFDDNPFEPVRGLCATRVQLRHDEQGSSGFVFDCAGVRIGYATDLGRAPPHLIDAFAGVDVLAIESNYDPTMQLSSGRPQFLVSRIMGGRGHLSNQQAFDAVKKILDRTEQLHGKLPSHVALLHRSRHCNCPDVMRELFQSDARLVERLVIAEQHQRTEWISPVARSTFRGEQLRLFASRPETVPMAPA